MECRVVRGALQQLLLTYHKVNEYLSTLVPIFSTIPASLNRLKFVGYASGHHPSANSFWPKEKVLIAVKKSIKRYPEVA